MRLRDRARERAFDRQNAVADLSRDDRIGDGAETCERHERLGGMKRRRGTRGVRAGRSWICNGWAQKGAFLESRVSCPARDMN
jgi:hypothetical protein